MMFLRPKSDRVEGEADALAKWEDPELAAERRRKAYGDWLDRIGLRTGMFAGRKALILIAGLVMFTGELAFSYFSGTVSFSWLGWFGGVLVCANSVAFVFLFSAWWSEWQENGKPIAKNGWTPLVVVSFVFAFFSIFTSQTTAADEVRLIVEKRKALEQSIGQMTADIENTFIPLREPVRINLEDAQDEAVGWRLATVTQDEAIARCAEVGGEFEAQMNCRKKMLRDSLNFTQDIDPRARDVVNRVNLYRNQLARIDEQETELAGKVKIRDDKRAELEATPEATNAFIQAISRLTGWEIEDATSRVYVFLALVFLLLPASIFAMTLERQKDDPAPEVTP